MQKLLDDLVLYSADKDQILKEACFLASEAAEEHRADCCRRIVKQLMEFACLYGFGGNLWHSYVAYYIASDQNPFSLEQERRKAENTAAWNLALSDCRILRKIFNWDFQTYFGKDDIGRNMAKAIDDYRGAVGLKSDAGSMIENFKKCLEDADNDEEFFKAVAEFYHSSGAGDIGLNKAFTVKVDSLGSAYLSPVKVMENIRLSDLIGYEVQKRQLTENTEAFLDGKPANNVLLYGDGGTGKSTSIRAISNRYCSEGLRIIQVYRHQMKYLGQIIEQIKDRNYKFIIYMDDLSFEDFETEYKYLKAVIEGGLEQRPENVLIYATSNRRHLIKETWNDRNDMEYNGDIHSSDSKEEKLSLSERFGVQIYYGKPTKEEFHYIVETLAQREKVNMSLEELRKEANKWEIRHGGVSGRSARQFIDYIKGTEENSK